MVTDGQYAAFWRSLDPDTQEIIRKMDEHENLGHHGHASEISETMIELLVRIYDRINVLAQRLSQNEATYDNHLETLLLILSFAPNSGAFWFIKELVENQPEAYQHIYSRVVTQEPLQMHGKLVRERLFFHLARDQVTNYIFSPENCLALRLALEGLVRAH